MCVFLIYLTKSCSTCFFFSQCNHWPLCSHLSPVLLSVYSLLTSWLNLSLPIASNNPPSRCDNQNCLQTLQNHPWLRTTDRDEPLWFLCGDSVILSVVTILRTMNAPNQACHVLVLTRVSRDEVRASDISTWKFMQNKLREKQFQILSSYLLWKK